MCQLGRIYWTKQGNPRAELRAYTKIRKERGMRKAVILCVPAVLLAQTAPSPSPEGVVYFETHIRPLLAANCYTCHSAKLARPMGGLLLDSRAGMLRGGKSGVPAIVPGKPDE